MVRRSTSEKQEYRFVIVDDTPITWAVLDNATGNKESGFRSPFDARLRAEELNNNPEFWHGD